MNWATKYRPNDFKKIALAPKIKKLFEEIIKNKNMGDFLFYSPDPGVGKTTLAKLLPEALGMEALFINASKDGNMDMIRDKMTRFADLSSIEYPNGKIIILDEAERISHQAQQSLRGFLEDESHKRVYYIFTVNDKSKIIEPIANSRLMNLDFTLPEYNKKDNEFVEYLLMPIFEYLKYILEDNNIQYDNKILIKYIKDEYPGIRKMVNKMQFSIFENEFNPEFYGKGDIVYEDFFINILKDKDYELIYKESEKITNYQAIISFIVQNIDNLFNPIVMPKVVELINDYQKIHSENIMFPKINFLHLSYELAKLQWK